VLDRGDVPRWRWRPDRDHRRAQNVGAVGAGADAAAALVQEALRAGQQPLVLGGDCTVGVGTVAGAVAAGLDPSLVYFDLHPDLNVPDAVPDGALDWMGVAHLLAEPGAVEELAGRWPRRPLLDQDRLVLLAHDPEHSTEFERAVIERRGLRGIPLAEVAREPRAAASRALELAGAEGRRYLVHFDVDVIDFVDMPLSENTGRNYGLPFAAAMDALEVLVAGPGLAAVTITELNPHHGARDGSTLHAFVERLARALRA
jgi:arginase